MTIKKYQGKTKEEAIENAKAELGPRVVIMNVKEVHPKGFLGSFKKPSYEVTAAVEDEFVPKEDETSVYIAPPVHHENNISREAEAEPQYEYTPLGGAEPAAAGKTYTKATPSGRAGGFDMTVDDTLGEALHPSEKKGARVTEDDLKSAFKEVNEVIENAEHISGSDVRHFSSESPVIKKNDVTANTRTTAHGMTGIEAAG